MKAGSVISYILAAIFIIFGFLFVLGAGSENDPSWIVYGIILLILGFVLILRACAWQLLPNRPFRT